MNPWTSAPSHPASSRPISFPHHLKSINPLSQLSSLGPTFQYSWLNPAFAANFDLHCWLPTYLVSLWRGCYVLVAVNGGNEWGFLFSPKVSFNPLVLQGHSLYLSFFAKFINPKSLIRVVCPCMSVCVCVWVRVCAIARACACENQKPWNYILHAQLNESIPA